MLFRSDIISHRSEWPSSKNLETINAGEGVEEREHSCTVGGNWEVDAATVENSMDVSQKTKNRVAI